MTDRYAVIGNPIAHSRSPEIHAAFASQTGEDISYERLLGDLEDFPGEVRDFFREGGKGLNVTVPFKERAWEIVDELSPRANTAGAVNTLVLQAGGALRGDNTDGVGLVRDLGCNHKFRFQGSRILLLGAGGASRGVLQPLLREHPVFVVVANRTAVKAVELARDFECHGSVSGCGLDELGDRAFDLIINATAAGLTGDVPEIPDNLLTDGGWAYDMMYSTEPTAFVRWGLEHGASNAMDGLGMLVEQAAESFHLWRGVRPDTETVIRNLRSAGR
jgi:shikimate dehydrogenase